MFSFIEGRVIIRHMTLQSYVNQALSLHANRGLPSPHLADINYIKIMTNAIKKYETVPKWKEMTSISLLHYIARLYKHTSEDSFVYTVINWIILGCYMGFCKPNGALTSMTHSIPSATPTVATAQCHYLSLPTTSASPPLLAIVYMTSQHHQTMPSYLQCSASESRKTMTIAKCSRTTVTLTPALCAPHRQA